MNKQTDKQRESNIIDKESAFDKTLIDIKKLTISGKARKKNILILLKNKSKNKVFLFISATAVIIIILYSFFHKNSKVQKIEDDSSLKEVQEIGLPTIKNRLVDLNSVNNSMGKGEEENNLDQINKIIEMAKKEEKNNNLEKAVSILKEARSTFGNNPDILIYSGYLHLKTRDYTIAVNLFFDALKYEKRKDAYYGLYRAYTELKEDDIARIYLKKYKQLEETN